MSLISASWVFHVAREYLLNKITWCNRLNAKVSLVHFDDQTFIKRKQVGSFNNQGSRQYVNIFLFTISCIRSNSALPGREAREKGTIYRR